MLEEEEEEENKKKNTIHYQVNFSWSKIDL